MEDADVSIHELVLRKWEQEWGTQLKVHVERIVEEMGCAWQDVVIEN